MCVINYYFAMENWNHFRVILQCFDFVVGQHLACKEPLLWDLA